MLPFDEGTTENAFPRTLKHELQALEAKLVQVYELESEALSRELWLLRNGRTFDIDDLAKDGKEWRNESTPTNAGKSYALLSRSEFVGSADRSSIQFVGQASTELNSSIQLAGQASQDIADVARGFSPQDSLEIEVTLHDCMDFDEGGIANEVTKMAIHQSKFSGKPRTPTLDSHPRTVSVISSSSARSKEVQKGLTANSLSPTESRQLHDGLFPDTLRKGNSTGSLPTPRRPVPETPKLVKTQRSSSNRHDYELHPMWLASAPFGRMSSTGKRTLQMSEVVSRFAQSQMSAKASFAYWTANPMSRRRLTWEALGTLFIVYDIVFIPLQAFSLPWKEERFAALCITFAYWLCDIPYNFFIGYFKNGVIESRLKYVMRHYVRSWFLPDLVLVVIDIVVIANGPEGHHHGHLARSGRVLRVLRILRLVRLFKLHSFFHKLLEHVKSEYVITMANVTMFIVLIVVINHFVACGWYLIGDLTHGWIYVFPVSDGNGYHYTTSLHWSLTQFTPAAMEVFPTNTTERTYSIIVLICALVMFSSVVGGITEAMTHLRKIRSEETKNYNDLRRYFADNHISTQLAMRIWKYLDLRSMLKHHSNWRNVQLLCEVPESMQMELKDEVYRPVLLRHPFWFQFADHFSAPVRFICHKAINESSLASGQDVFHAGHPASNMHFVMNGELTYYQCHENSDVIGAAIEIGKSYFISEACIWLRFFHTGTLIAKPLAVLMSVEAQGLHSIIHQYVDCFEECKAYATLYHRDVSSRIMALSDIDNDFEELQRRADLAFSMCAHDSSCYTVTSTNKTAASKSHNFLSDISHRFGRWVATVSRGRESRSGSIHGSSRGVTRHPSRSENDG